MNRDKAKVRQVLDAVKAAGRASLTAPEGKQLCDAYGIAVPQEGVATSAAEAQKLAASMGFPVVMKIVSPDILHKTEARGVLVGVKSADDAAKGFDTIIANAKKHKADAQIVGVQVQQMLKGGQEVIVGAVTDNSFGKLVAFGLGGVLVEVLKDRRLALAPVDELRARSMVDRLEVRPLLEGVRGQPAADVDALTHAIAALSWLAHDLGDHLEALDANPLICGPNGCVALDALMILRT